MAPCGVYPVAGRGTDVIASTGRTAVSDAMCAWQSFIARDAVARYSVSSEQSRGARTVRSLLRRRGCGEWPRRHREEEPMMVADEHACRILMTTTSVS